MKNPTLRLTRRLAPYVLYSFIILALVVLMFAALFLGKFHHSNLLILLGGIWCVAIYRMIILYMGGTTLARELKERAGKPIKVFYPGRKNFRFLKGLGWISATGTYYPVFISPCQDKYTFTKHLFMLDPSSDDFSDQLLEVAATNEKAFQEISSKVSTGKYRASRDLRMFEDANAVSEAITDTMK